MNGQCEAGHGAGFSGLIWSVRRITLWWRLGWGRVPHRPTRAWMFRASGEVGARA